MNHLAVNSHFSGCLIPLFLRRRRPWSTRPNKAVFFCLDNEIGDIPDEILYPIFDGTFTVVFTLTLRQERIVSPPTQVKNDRLVTVIIITSYVDGKTNE